MLVSSRMMPALALPCVQTTWSPTENNSKRRSTASPPAAPTMEPPIWVTEVSICSVPTPAKVTLLATELPLPSSSVPPLPASSRPPPSATIVPELLVGPFSVSDPPALTVMVPALAAVPALVDARVPSTITPAPFDTLQGALPLNVPVSVQDALMTLKILKPWYCSVEPIALRLKVPLPAPPSCKMSLPVPCTKPLMA